MFKKFFVDEICGFYFVKITFFELQKNSETSIYNRENYMFSPSENKMCENIIFQM